VVVPQSFYSHRLDPLRKTSNALNSTPASGKFHVAKRERPEAEAAAAGRFFYGAEATLGEFCYCSSRSAASVTAAGPTSPMCGEREQAAALAEQLAALALATSKAE
jgi:hypothetical protein